MNCNHTSADKAEVVHQMLAVTNAAIASCVENPPDGEEPFTPAEARALIKMTVHGMHILGATPEEIAEGILRYKIAEEALSTQ